MDGSFNCFLFISAFFVRRKYVVTAVVQAATDVQRNQFSPTTGGERGEGIIKHNRHTKLKIAPLHLAYQLENPPCENSFGINK